MQEKLDEMSEAGEEEPIEHLKKKNMNFLNVHQVRMSLQLACAMSFPRDVGCMRASVQYACLSIRLSGCESGGMKQTLSLERPALPRHRYFPMYLPRHLWITFVSYANRKGLLEW